ncbi:hypothetical protein B0H17DRAFT_207473 [Mycena rosella]|uniref:DUF6533 domain-containing protein n=1 Tax=Mycena rosella TaxID=1033263 RepID=A0AAD7G5V4_MYCRO|nr:hypothetical protein B0H17DRAFT_207473 [Mycena rosella]
MSSKVITAATTHFLQFRLQYSSLALLYYDFALTFPKEVQYMWKERFRLSTALYIGCRYALIANVLYLLAVADKLGSTVHRCDSWYKIVGALSVLGRVAVVAVFTMRTYAVFGKSNWVLAYMSLVGLACIALDITHVPGMRCVGSSSLPMSPEMLSILMVIFESSSAFLTTTRCVIAFREGGGMKNQGIMFILFEQGILYFCTISIFTAAAVILNYRAPPGFFQRLPNAFTLPLSCILTARFILHLREWEAVQVNGGTGHRTEVSVAEFRATSRSGALSSLVGINDFGTDPVVTARTTVNRPEVQMKDMQSNSESGSTELESGFGEVSDQSDRVYSPPHKREIELV